MEEFILKKEELTRFGYLILGTLIYCIGLNIFIVPVHLYSGGIIGLAQIIRTVMIEYLHLSLPSSFDVAGIINFMINIPLFYLAYKTISKNFFQKTILSVGLQMLFLSMIPIVSTPILDDVLASCLIGGVICGAGIGLCLRNGGSGGGIDIIGIYYTKRFSRASVGQLSVYVNIFVFGLCAFLFNLETAIYSIIYTYCMSIVMDRVHYQNINVSVMIFTKNKEIVSRILNETGRGVTYWKGIGAYTDEEAQIIMTAINKYEINQIKKIVYNADPNAFVIFNEGLSIVGNFEKRI